MTVPSSRATSNWRFGVDVSEWSRQSYHWCRAAAEMSRNQLHRPRCGEVPRALADPAGNASRSRARRLITGTRPRASTIRMPWLIVSSVIVSASLDAMLRRFCCNQRNPMSPIAKVAATPLAIIRVRRARNRWKTVS